MLLQILSPAYGWITVLPNPIPHMINPVLNKLLIRYQSLGAAPSDVVGKVCTEVT